MQIGEETRRRRRAGRTAVVVAMLAGTAVLLAGAVAWLTAESLLDDEIARIRAGLPERGVAVAWSDEKTFVDLPLTVGRRFGAVEIVAAGGGRLTATAAAATFSPLRPDEGMLRLDGAVWDAGNAAVWRAEVVTVALRVPPPPADHTQPGLIATATAAGVTPPALWRALVGGEDARGAFTVTATLTGAPPPALTAPALEAWRTAGGVVQLAPVRGEYGPLRLDGDGTLALDGELQPTGAGTARLTGVDTALAQVITAAERGVGPFRLKEARQARQMAALLAQPDPAGGPPQLTLPLTAQHRRLFLGPLRVAELPRVSW